MSDKDQKQESHLEKLITNVVGYVDTQFQLIQLEVKEEIAKAITNLTLFVIISSIVSFAGLLFSIALAIYLGQLFHSYVYGFAILGGIYVVLSAILISQYPRIKAKASALINQKMKQIELTKQKKLEA